LSNEFVKLFGLRSRTELLKFNVATSNAAFNGKFSPDIEDVKQLQLESCVIEYRIIKQMLKV
jgi:hypothetical protein